MGSFVDMIAIFHYLIKYTVLVADVKYLSQEHHKVLLPWADSIFAVMLQLNDMADRYSQLHKIISR